MSGAEYADKMLGGTRTSPCHPRNKINYIRNTINPLISSCRGRKKHKTATHKQGKMGKLLNSVPASPVEELLSHITSTSASQTITDCSRHH